MPGCQSRPSRRPPPAGGSPLAAQEVGPIDYLAVEFPGTRLQAKGLAALLDLAERGIIRILDLRVAKLTETGDVIGVALPDHAASGS